MMRIVRQYIQMDRQTDGHSHCISQTKNDIFIALSLSLLPHQILHPKPNPGTHTRQTDKQTDVKTHGLHFDRI